MMDAHSSGCGFGAYCQRFSLKLCNFHVQIVPYGRSLVDNKPKITYGPDTTSSAGTTSATTSTHPFSPTFGEDSQGDVSVDGF